MSYHSTSMDVLRIMMYLFRLHNHLSHPESSWVYHSTHSSLTDQTLLDKLHWDNKRKVIYVSHVHSVGDLLVYTPAATYSALRFIHAQHCSCTLMWTYSCRCIVTTVCTLRQSSWSQLTLPNQACPVRSVIGCVKHPYIHM